MLELTQTIGQEKASGDHEGVMTLSAADMTPSFGCIPCQEEVSTNVFTCTGHAQMQMEIGEMKGKEASLHITMEHLKLSFYGTERLHLLASSSAAHR